MIQKYEKRMLYILNAYNTFRFSNDVILLIVVINATYDFHVVNKWVSVRPGIGWFAGQWLDIDLLRRIEIVQCLGEKMDGIVQ